MDSDDRSGAMVQVEGQLEPEGRRKRAEVCRPATLT